MFARSVLIAADALVVSSVSSLLVGAGLAALGGFLVRGVFFWMEMKAARAAIRAELQAILHMFEQERFVQNIESEILWLETTNEPREFPVNFRNGYNIVFAGNVSKLGLLVRWRSHDYWSADSDFLSDLTRFYYSVQTIIEVAEMIRDAELPEEPRKELLGSSVSPIFSLSDPDHRLAAFKRLLNLTKQARAEARDLSTRI